MDKPTPKPRAMARTQAMRQLEERVKKLEIENAELRGRCAAYEAFVRQLMNKGEAK